MNILSILIHKRNNSYKSKIMIKKYNEKVVNIISTK